MRRDNELHKEAQIAQKATERKNNIVVSKPKKATKLNIRNLI